MQPVLYSLQCLGALHLVPVSLAGPILHRLALDATWTRVGAPLVGYG